MNPYYRPFQTDEERTAADARYELERKASQAKHDAEQAERLERSRKKLTDVLWFTPSKRIAALLQDQALDDWKISETADCICEQWRNCGAGPRHSRRIENHHAAWQTVFDTVTGKLGTGFIIALVGPRGTGKTMLAVQACRWAIERMQHQNYKGDAPVLYRPLMDVFLAVRATYKSETRESEQTILDALENPALLVLDEVQERSGTEFENRLLTHVIDARYMAQRDTLLIGNLTAAMLAESLGPSIVSRMEETGGTITMDWETFRKQATT